MRDCSRTYLAIVKETGVGRCWRGIGTLHDKTAFVAEFILHRNNPMKPSSQYDDIDWLLHTNVEQELQQQTDRQFLRILAWFAVVAVSFGGALLLRQGHW